MTDKTKCPSCGGTGIFHFPMDLMPYRCSTCKGSGVVSAERQKHEVKEDV